MITKFSCVIAILIFSALSVFPFSVSFEGNSRSVVEIEGNKSTGLDYIYVAYNSKEIDKLSISGLSGTVFDIKRYSNLGGGFAEDVPFSVSDGRIIISKPEGNIGYLLSTSTGTSAFWLVDYASQPLHLSSINLLSDQDCESTSIEITGSGEPIHYYTIDGRQQVLSREILLEYNTLEWNVEQSIYDQVSKQKTLDAIGRVLLIPPVYSSTTFNVKGDRFLKVWESEQTIESSVFRPNAVMVNSFAEQTNGNQDDADNSSNVIAGETSGLGGSAPADISFTGYISDAVLHTEWQMATDGEFDNILYRFNEQDFNYTFLEEGQYYIRFIGSNADGSCEAIGDTYEVTIGASDLRIPNAFSPNNDGVNDVWKVGYRSLIEFECWIYNTKGTQLFHFKDPSDGWDGKYKGRAVNPGVYYYVIQALGADGKKYKKSGDINILNYKKIGESTVETPSEEE